MGASAGGQVDGEKAAKVVASLGYAKPQVGRLLQHGARRTVVMENIFVAMELLLELCEQPATPAFVKQGGLPLLAKVAGATGTATQQPNPAWQAPRPGLEEQVASEGKEQDVNEGEDEGGEGLPAAHASPSVYEAEAANTAVGCSSSSSSASPAAAAGEASGKEDAAEAYLGEASPSFVVQKLREMVSLLSEALACEQNDAHVVRRCQELAAAQHELEAAIVQQEHALVGGGNDGKITR